MTLASHDLKNAPETTYLKDYQPSAFLIDTIDLSFDLNENHTRVTSTMSIRRNPAAKQETKNLILNGELLELVSIKINGTLLPEHSYQVDKSTCTILDMPNECQCEIVTNIKPHLNKALSGLYLSNQHYCTQCEAEGFRRITYFLDRPDVLSKYTTTISADKKKFPILLSNGNLIEQADLPDGKHIVKWSDPFKKPCYLFALVAGDFDVIEDKFVTMTKRDIALKIYVEKGHGDEAHHAMYSLKEAMQWDEKAFGREYDLDTYMIVAISDFNMGAMENKGLNVFNTKYVLAKPATATDDDFINILSVIGHEYFHNWSGNRVTCRDWFQLSLKEGLTIFRDQSFSEDILSKALIRIREVNSLREFQFSEDAGPLAHPVRPDSYIEINNFYTTTIYNKGAEVLRMLQTILGEKQFRKGMDRYFDRYDGQAVTIEDFVTNMEEISGIDLKQFRLWYTQAGTPIVTIEDDFDEKKQIYRLTINQHTPDTPDQVQKQALHIPIKLGLIDKQGKALVVDDEGKLESVYHLTQGSQTFTFNNIKSRPIPSLFRHFSAPVKWDYHYSDDELAVLAKHDTDAFNRYEALQRYLLRMLLGLVEDYQHDKPSETSSHLATLFADLLNDDRLDPILKSEMITLPSEKYIAEQMDIVDVEAIHHARETLMLSLANQLKHQFLSIYENLKVRINDNDSSVETFSIQTVGYRHLKNRCLMYLMLLPEFEKIGIAQFEKSLGHNMSDTQAALVSLVNQNTPYKLTALQQFYELYRDDALVIDKWLSVQATSKGPDTLSVIKKLLHHEAFDIKNPNKVYALIGAFGMRNPTAFHTESGEGYAFLREIVSKLDKFNPQVASRMVKPLTEWQRYGKERQSMMSQQLETLLQEKLSNDLFELVSKSLHSGVSNE